MRPTDVAVGWSRVDVEFRLLGEVEVRVDGHLLDVGHVRQRCVLAALLVEANRTIPVERLVERTWGTDPPQRARETLYSYLSRLRRALAGARGVAIVRRPGGYALTVDPDCIDLHRFQHLVSSGRAGRPSADAHLDEALALWRGEPFAHLDAPWLHGIRANLRAQRLAAELDRNDRAMGRGEHARLLDPLRARVAEYPLDERLAAQLMLVLYRCGRQADALDRYERVRRRLAAELGADPSPPLRTLHQRILTGDPALADPEPASTQPASPEPASPGGPDPVGPASPVPRQLPAVPSSFTGRVRELAALDELVDGPDGHRTMVISAVGGVGGIGKTWLALRWAHDNARRFPDGQLHVNLRGFDPTSDPVPPSVALAGFLTALGVPSAALPTGVDAQAALYRSLVVDKRMLIVLDNAYDTEQVAPLLPGAAACVVLVTSRRRLGSLIAAHDARPLTLDVLTEPEAAALLTDRLGAERVAAEAEPVATLLRHCAGLPLALGIIAARAAASPETPLATLADELRDASTRLDALDAGELPVNVRAVLACSRRSLSPAAAGVLAVLGLAPGADIGAPATASLTGLPVTRVRPLLRELVSAHLVQEHVPGRYRMHDLVRLYAAELGDAEPGRAEAARCRVLDHYLHTAHRAAALLSRFRDLPSPAPPAAGVQPADPVDYPQALAWFTAEHDVLLAALSQAASHGLDTVACQLAWTLMTYLERQGHWHDWTVAGHAGLAAARKLADRRAEAHFHRWLARAYVWLGRSDDAGRHADQALALFGELGDRIGQAHVHHDLGLILARQGRYRDAVPHAERTLRLHRAAGHRFGEAGALNALGWILIQTGDPQQALIHCEQALVVFTQLDDKHGQANTWDSLAAAHHRLGQLDQAATCYRQAWHLLHELGNRRAEADALAGLAEVLQAAGDTSAARVAWQDALELFTDLGQPEADQIRARLAATNGGR